MKPLVGILILLVCACLGSGDGIARPFNTAATAPQDTRIAVAIEEIDEALDAYFALIDEKNLDRFISGVMHASRARLLLEQYLGEDTDNYGFELAERDEFRHSLIMIASHARRFTADEARDMWMQDSVDYDNATQRLAELDVMVKGFKKQYLNSQ